MLLLALALALPVAALAKSGDAETDRQRTGSPESMAASTPKELAEAFGASPKEAYWALAGNAVPLQPVFRYFEEQAGLTKPKAGEGMLTFSVARGSEAQWGGQKTVSVPAEGLDAKAWTAPAASLVAIIQALEGQWNAPEGLAALAGAPQAAYFELAREGLSLAPIFRYLEGRGLTKPKVGKDSVSFTVAKGYGEQWNGEKTVKAALLWADGKARTVALKDLPALVQALGAQWTLAPPPPMTEEEIAARFPNCEWAYTYLMASGDVRTEGAYTYKQCEGGVYAYEARNDGGGPIIYATYYPREGEAFYRLYDPSREEYILGTDEKEKPTLTVYALTEYDRRQHPLASGMDDFGRYRDPKARATVITREENIAGRSATHYALGATTELWVDNEFGLVLKYTYNNPGVGSVAYETTRLTFGVETWEEIFDINQFRMGRNNIEEEADKETPRGRDLIPDYENLREQLPYLHVEYVDVGTGSGVGANRNINHRSAAGTYTLSVLPGISGTGQTPAIIYYWETGQPGYYFSSLGETELSPADENPEFEASIAFPDATRFADDRLFLEAEGETVAGRPAKRYGGKTDGRPFQIWLDDEYGFALQYEIFYDDGATRYAMMRTTALALEDTGFPTLDEVIAMSKAPPELTFTHMPVWDGLLTSESDLQTLARLEARGGEPVPLGMDLITPHETMDGKFPYLHVEYIRDAMVSGSPGAEYAQTLEKYVGHRSAAGLYSASQAMAEETASSGRYWDAKEDHWYEFTKTQCCLETLTRESRDQLTLDSGLPIYEYEFMEGPMYLEEEGALIAGRPAKRYLGQVNDMLYRVWIDDEYGFVLKCEMLQPDCKTLYMYMEITALELGDQGLPTLEEMG